MYLINIIGQEIVLKIRENLYKYILSFRYSFFDKNPVGMLVTRVISDIETIAEIFSQGLFAMISDILKLFLINVIWILYYNLKLVIWDIND